MGDYGHRIRDHIRRSCEHGRIRRYYGHRICPQCKPLRLTYVVSATTAAVVATMATEVAYVRTAPSDQ